MWDVWLVGVKRVEFVLPALDDDGVIGARLDVGLDSHGVGSFRVDARGVD